MEQLTYSDMMAPMGQVWGVVGLLLSLLLTLRYALKPGANRQAYLAGWLLRAMFCVYNSYFHTFVVDAFESMAYDMSLNPLPTIMANFGVNSSLYTWLCALIYYECGRSPVLLQAINIACWVISQSAIAKIAALLGAGRAGRRAEWVYAFFPTGIFLSTAILRESICIMGIVYGVYEWLRAAKLASLRHYVLCIAWFLWAALFHYGCIVLILGVVIAPFAMRFRSGMHGTKRLLYQVGLLGGSGLLIVALFYGHLFDAVAPNLDPDSISVERLNERNTGVEVGRTDYMEGLFASSLATTVLLAPVRFTFFLVAPFPWMVRKTIDLWAMADALIYTWIVVMGLRRWKMLVADYRMFGVVVFCTMGLLVFAMGTVNYGTAMRHRAKFFPVVVTVALSAWEIGANRGRVMRQRPGMRRGPVNALASAGAGWRGTR